MHRTVLRDEGHCKRVHLGPRISQRAEATEMVTEPTYFERAADRSATDRSSDV